ncbi:MAG: hypothetical protein NT045_01225 [Candidatus Aureabacteria bacterium]|nr:hypothetical protein [Candidatus Auribacterota bacterium]
MKMPCLPSLSCCLASLALSGCAIRNITPAPHPVYCTATLAELRQRLSANSIAISTIKASFSASLTDRRKGTTQTCSGMLAMARPDKLRMKGSKAMLPMFFDLFADGRQIFISVPRDHAVYRSSRAADAEGGGLPAVRRITGLFLGTQDDPKQIDVVESTPSRYIIYSIAAGGTTARIERRVTFDRTDLSPVRTEYFGADGSPVCDMRCADFFTPAKAPTARLPRRVTLEAPPGGTALSLTLSDMRVNQQLNPALFTMEMPEGARIRPLEEFGR